MTFLDVFEYRDGKLYWKTKLPGKVRIGDLVGYKAKNGYMMVKLQGKVFMLHRIIWEMFNGQIPDGHQIDHIDHNRTNNLIGNLRAVTVQGNNKNSSKRADNVSGTTGVYWDSINSKWVAHIRVNKRAKNLGRFSEYADAVEARKKAEIEYGFHKNHGK